MNSSDERQARCPKCYGVGILPGKTERCDKCHGRGWGPFMLPESPDERMCVWSIGRDEWHNEHNPRPVHAELGPVQCPDIVLWRLDEVREKCCPDRCARCAPISVQVGKFGAWAAWESPDSDDNKAHWREAEMIVTALNAGWAALHAGQS